MKQLSRSSAISAAAPALILAGSIVADLWHQTVPGNAGRGCVAYQRARHIRCWAVGISGINALYLLTPSFPPLFLLLAA